MPKQFHIIETIAPLEENVIVFTIEEMKDIIKITNT